MNRIWIIVACSLVLAAPALADDDRPFRQHDRERIADRVEQRFERRADRAEALGKDRLANHLRTRGERLANHLDRKGDRIEARYDRRGGRFERTLDRHGDYGHSHRDRHRHEHAYVPLYRDRWCGEHLTLQLNGLGIYWGHRH